MLSLSIDLNVSGVYGLSISLKTYEMCDAKLILNHAWVSMGVPMKSARACLAC